MISMGEKQQMQRFFLMLCQICPSIFSAALLESTKSQMSFHTGKLTRAIQNHATRYCQPSVTPTPSLKVLAAHTCSLLPLPFASSFPPSPARQRHASFAQMRRCPSTAALSTIPLGHHKLSVCLYLTDTHHCQRLQTNSEYFVMGEGSITLYW